MNFFLRFLPCISIIYLVFFQPLSLLAQSDIPEDIVVGGLAKCIIKGKAPFKKVVVDGNRLLLLQNDGITQGSIIFQLIDETKKNIIDIKAFALLGIIQDVESFLSGEKLSFENTGSDLVLKKTVKNKDITIEVTNIFDDGTKSNLTGEIKLKSAENDLVTGKIRVLFQETILKITENGDTETFNNNGKIEVKCKFKDVPLQIKPL